ncbi:MAG: cyclic nucleotide-binding domain-containing protein, partial [Gammaproteobacteria bacterium]|nr:cyclic nucleotide-binding domain-containing protein [Gammaproteobacteria bacterium]
MLQGGAFANLAEFPVLQMLYRQGLILPNHPNNTDQKPLLIGLPQQVEAQLRYIHRGNYGLTSKDELMAAGLTEEAAEEMMRIKLHFAFGKIQSANELLDCLLIDQKTTEIRNGVFIRRIGMNHYRFQYEDERVEVDINLPDSESYASPYPLGMHQVAREYFSVIHSGEGDGWDIDRPCMSSILSFQGRLYLIDAGPNLEAILKALSLSVNELEGIFHTHSHDDHLAGLSALLQSNHRLRYFTVPMVRAAVTKKLAALLSMDEEEFSIFFDVVDLDPETWNDVDGLEVKPMMSPHPVETSVFQFRALGSNGYKTYAHLADIAANRVLSNMVTDDADKPGLSPALFQKVKSNYGAFANLKKIDIGGGLIHGDAEDFVDDESDKIVLAHVARPLTSEERQIGSGADFGTTDVLIPATQEYLRRLAYTYLQSYFPKLPVSQLHILLNNELRTFNPHEILVREGELINEVVLVLSGNAEALRAGSSEIIRLVAGDLFGELPVLRQSSATV